MARVTLRAGYAALALRIQESMDAGDALSAGDIQKRLVDSLNDIYGGSGGSGQWAYYIDHFGDAESGDVIYVLNGDCTRAPYSIVDTAAASKCVIDVDNAEDVQPRTIYEPEVDEDEHFAAMLEAKLYTSGGIALCERFVNRKTREKMDPADFAGKGKSYPIRNQEDLDAAVRSLGRAGPENYPIATLKANIKRIGKRKGLSLPKAWQDGDTKSAESAVVDFSDVFTRLREAGARHSKADMQQIQSIHDMAGSLGADCAGGGTAKESAVTGSQSGQLKLTESAASVEVIQLREAKADYPIKLISPGPGVTAWYPAEVLKRDGPSAFPAETKVYLNHPTKAQENGVDDSGNRDVLRLAGVLTQAAEWRESNVTPKGDTGPGLYSRFKVFADHAQLMEEKSPYLDMSIVANGSQLVEAGKKVFKEGRPVLGALTRGESVDVVPKAGAGGMILQESARAGNSTQEASMDAEELKLLRESLASQQAATNTLLEKERRREAIAEGAKALKGLSLTEAQKEYVIQTVLRDALPVKDGVLDTAKFTESLSAEAKRFAAANGGDSGRVRGMGASAPVAINAKEAERKQAEQKQRFDRAVKNFRAMNLTEAAAKAAAEKLIGTGEAA